MAEGPDDVDESLEATRNRVCLLIDVDAFEVQVYQKYLYPDTVGKICVVANPKDRITAVSYEAKKAGLSRDDEYVGKARKKVPNLTVLRIPVRADSSKPDFVYARRATTEITDAIKKFCGYLGSGWGVGSAGHQPTFEFSSKDEFYLDMTALVQTIMNTRPVIPAWVRNLGRKCIVETARGPVNIGDDRVWKSHWVPPGVEPHLLYGLCLASDLASLIKKTTGFQVSVGVGPNKLIAKLACNKNKPAGMTLIPRGGFEEVTHSIKITDVPGLNGKAGKVILQMLSVEDIDGTIRPVKVMSDLIPFSVRELGKLPSSLESGSDPNNLIGSTKANDFYNAVRGICNDPIVDRIGPGSISCTNSFNGLKSWFSSRTLKVEMRALVAEMLERANEERMIRQREPLAIKFSIYKSGEQKVSRSMNFSNGERSADEIVDNLLVQFDREICGLTGRMNIVGLEIKGEPFMNLENEARPTMNHQNSFSSVCYVYEHPRNRNRVRHVRQVREPSPRARNMFECMHIFLSFGLFMFILFVIEYFIL